MQKEGRSFWRFWVMTHRRTGIAALISLTFVKMTRFTAAGRPEIKVSCCNRHINSKSLIMPKFRL